MLLRVKWRAGTLLILISLSIRPHRSINESVCQSDWFWCCRFPEQPREQEAICWMRNWVLKSTIYQLLHDSRLKRDCLDSCHCSLVLEAWQMLVGDYFIASQSQFISSLCLLWWAKTQQTFDLFKFSGCWPKKYSSWLESLTNQSEIAHKIRCIVLRLFTTPPHLYNLYILFILKSWLI